MIVRWMWVIFASVLIFAGCMTNAPRQSVSSEFLVNQPTGTLLNRQAFVLNGTIAVLPFKAGEGASADPQLDRISMMISKGIIDYLQEQKLPMTVLTTQDQGTPDMVIEGYIQGFKKSGQFNRWVLRRSASVLTVQGQLLVLKNRERILVFKQTKDQRKTSADPTQVAYQTGQDIGKFIADIFSEN